MNDRKTINIFLASSIKEFAIERMEIENFIRNVSDKFEEHYDIKIQPLLCENFDDEVKLEGMQEYINGFLRKSDFSFFIFFTKTGEYTEQEFDVAFEKLKETGKPKISTYFKVIHDEEVEESLYKFMEKLDKIVGHYYGSFEHIDTVKLRILLKLKLQEMDFLEIKIDGENCLVDGRKTLSLKNVSEFANNSIFKELKAELEDTEKRYYELKPKYKNGEYTKAEEREYIEVATKRQNLIDAIEELQKNIFNMSLRMCKDEERGDITLRQKEAYRLFEKGDLEGANSILDFAEIESDYLRDIAIMEANIKKRSEIFIRETKTKIDILKTMTGLTTRFVEIEELYDKILPVVFKFNVETDTVVDFAAFLYEQNKDQKAYEVAKSLEERLTNGTDDEILAEAYKTLGAISIKLPSKKSEAEKYQKKAIEIYEQLAEVNPERFNPDLAGSYNNAGKFYKDQGQYDKTETFYNKAIEIRKRLAEAYPERFNPDLADSYNNAGIFYARHGQPDKAEMFYNNAIEIYENIDKTNPERSFYHLARCYNNTGNFYAKNRQPDKAEALYKKAIKIYEKLADINPEKFSPDLASSYNNAGALYYKQRKPDKAEPLYKKAVKIREKLAKAHPERFNSDLGESYNNMAALFKDNGQPDKAATYFRKAVKIYEQLAVVNPERFNPELAACCFNYAIHVNNYTYFIKALSLAKEAPDDPYCRQIIKMFKKK